MTWTKLSDDYPDDCWQLTDAAFRLHTEGLCWSNRKLLDLRLAKDELRRWAKHPEAAGELVACGWWTDEGGHYLIVHHGRYQRPRDVVLRLQKRNQQNGVSGGRPPKVPRERFSPNKTQPDTQMGSEVETQRDGTGRDGPGIRESGTALSAGMCEDCGELPATGKGFDPTRCSGCTAERAADAAEAADQ